jgi:hypothetical protein
MSSSAAAAPILVPRQFEFGSEWYVHVEWPSGTKQQVGAFKSEGLALAWIQDRSAKWLQERPAMLQHA